MIQRWLLLMLAVSNLTFAFHHMAYVEVNDHALTNIGCFVHSTVNKPYFDMAGIFAANINGLDPNHPEIYFNPQVDHVLNKTNSVTELQQKGIKVVLSLLGNHKNAGWSCKMSERAAQTFAHNIAKVVEKYHLDGIDIDDEYSKCAENNTNMIMISQYLKSDPLFKGKLLTKALWHDKQIFSSNYNGVKLSKLLDYGWEMGYGSGGVIDRLKPYTNLGMEKSKLMLGISEFDSHDYTAYWSKQTFDDGYQGIMYFNLTSSSLPMLNVLAKAEGLKGVMISPNCLKY